MSGLNLLVDRRAKQLGISINEVARRTGVSPAALSKLMTGKTKNPDITTFIGLSQALDLPVRDLLSAFGVNVEQVGTTDPNERAVTILGSLPELQEQMEKILELRPDDRDAVFDYIQHRLQNSQRRAE